MKKTIAKLIELGFVVSRIKGYEIFSTDFVYITNKDKSVIAQVDDEKEVMTLVKFHNNKPFTYVVFGQYLSDESSKLFRNNLRKVIYDIGKPLDHADNFIPEKFRGKKMEPVLKTDIPKAKIKVPIEIAKNTYNPSQAINSRHNDVFLFNNSNDEYKEMIKDLIKARGCLTSRTEIKKRKFNLNVFIQNVLKEVFNGDRDCITFDITGFNTIIFSRYSTNINLDNPYMWRVTIDLNSLDNAMTPFIANVDIIDSEVKIHEIFNAEHDISEFVAFYRNFKKQCA